MLLQRPTPHFLARQRLLCRQLEDLDGDLDAWEARCTIRRILLLRRHAVYPRHLTQSCGP